MIPLLIRHLKDIPPLQQDTLLEVCPVFINNYGLPYYLELWQRVRQENPSLKIGLAIPCGEDVGLALAAIEAKVTKMYILVKDQADPLYIKLSNLGASNGVNVDLQNESPWGKNNKDNL
jgi:hypothetical protein